MGVELRQDLDMDDGHVFSDYDLALHVKDVLLSVSSVSPILTVRFDFQFRPTLFLNLESSQGDAVSVENYRELVLSLYNQPERQSPDDVAKLVVSVSL